MDSLAIIVLAAGFGKRMGSPIPKVLHTTIEKTLIEHVLANAALLEPERMVVVTGFAKEKVEAEVLSAQARGAFGAVPLSFAFQEKQLGTGDAARAGLHGLEGFSGTVLLLYGDVPLLKQETLRELLERKRRENASLVLISAISDTQRAYGRIIREPGTRKILCVTEAGDCTPEEYLIREVNSGIYAIDSELLPAALESLQNNNAQGEYYLTDVVGYASSHGHKVEALTIWETEDLQGVNNLQDLQLINATLHKRRREALLASGVFMTDAASVFIDPQAVIEPEVHIGPNVQIKGATTLRRGTVIEGTAWIENCTIEADAVIRLGVRMEEAHVGARTAVGPFAHLRPGTVLGEDVRVGNFVEVKKSTLEDGVKASHLTYIGDTSIGANTNIGAGTITCNYDGRQKHKTTIGKDCFVGSDTVLIAPVNVHDGAYIGAASVVNKEVPAGALAVSRPPLTIKEGWAERRSRDIHERNK